MWSIWLKARGKPLAIISPITFAAVQKFDAVFAAERAIIRSAARRARELPSERDRPLVDDLIEWMKRERAKLSRYNDVAKAMGDMLTCRRYVLFLNDGRIRASNNSAEPWPLRNCAGRSSTPATWEIASSTRLVVVCSLASRSLPPAGSSPCPGSALNVAVWSEEMGVSAPKLRSRNCHRLQEDDP